MNLTSSDRAMGVDQMKKVGNHWINQTGNKVIIKSAIYIILNIFILRYGIAGSEYSFHY